MFKRESAITHCTWIPIHTNVDSGKDVEGGGEPAAQLCRASPPGLCRAGRPGSRPGMTIEL